MTLARIIWGTLAAIGRLPETAARYTVAAGFTLLLANWIGWTTNNRAEFWTTAWDIATGRVPR